MAKKKSPADRLRARAREVRHDASYGGIFEMCVWSSMRKTALFLVYGVTVINVLGCFGKQLKASEKDKAHTILVGKMIDGRLMSASKPKQTMPDVNHFVIARSKQRGTVMN